MDSVEARMRAAFELHELAVAMRREVLKRDYPHENETQIEARLNAWLLQADPPKRLPRAEPTP